MCLVWVMKCSSFAPNSLMFLIEDIPMCWSSILNDKHFTSNTSYLFYVVQGYMFRSSLTIIRPVCESCFTNSGYILGSHYVYNFASVYTSYINTLNHTARYRLTVVLQATSQQEHQKHQKRRSPTSSRAYPTSKYNSCTIHYSVPRL